MIYETSAMAMAKNLTWNKRAARRVGTFGGGGSCPPSASSSASPHTFRFFHCGLWEIIIALGRNFTLKLINYYYSRISESVKVIKVALNTHVKKKIARTTHALETNS